MRSLSKIDCANSRSSFHWLADFSDYRCNALSAKSTNGRTAKAGNVRMYEKLPWRMRYSIASL